MQRINQGFGRSLIQVGMLHRLTKQPTKAYEDMRKTQMDKQTNTYKTGVNSQCNESSGSTGSHRVLVGEAESTYFWNLQMTEIETGKERQREKEKQNA